MSAGPGGGWGRRLRSLAVDTTPLRESVGYRWLFIGQLGAQISRQLLVVAVPYQVFVLTESSLLVGLVGLAQVVPMVVFSILGGTVADAFDRRRVLLVVQLLMACTSVGFALNAGSGAALWPIFALIAANAGISGVESPTRSAIIPRVVPRGLLPSAFALNQSLTQTSQVVGPAVAGVLMARFGVGVVYVISATAVGLATLALAKLAPQRPEGATGRVSLRATAEGWHYLRRVPLLQQLMLVDLNAMVLGMPRALFPVIGLEVLGGDAATVGLLHAAPGAGALLGALTTGWVAAVRRQGRMVALAAMVWGASIAVFGLTRSLGVALFVLAVAGASDVVSNVFRNTVLQEAVPDALRGRLTAYKVSLSGAGPHLGDTRAGAVADVTSPTISLVSGGLLAIVGTVLVARWRRDLWDQHADDRPPDLGGAAPGG